MERLTELADFVDLRYRNFGRLAAAEQGRFCRELADGTTNAATEHDGNADAKGDGNHHPDSEPERRTCEAPSTTEVGIAMLTVQ